MNEYLSKEYITKLLDARLSNSRGAEHYAYETLKNELADKHDVVIGPWDFEVICPRKPIEVSEYCFACPCCDDYLGIDQLDLYVFKTPLPNYCSNCGQKLDWSDWE